jgi:PII-like signaling protein
MKGVQLRFYTCENRRTHGVLIHDWLLSTARASGVHGGTATRAIAGFGRHGQMHEQHFFELAGDVPVVVEFLLDEATCWQLLDRIAAENLSLLYSCTPVDYGVTGSLPAAD